MLKKPKHCPKCQSKKVVPIVYGMPSMEAGKEAEAGKYVLGGCCISDKSPKWHCLNCEHELGTYMDIVDLELSVPIKLKFSVGGFSDLTQFVKFENGKLHYGQCIGNPEYGETIVSVVPSGRKWKNFKNKLDAIDVWNWKKSYNNNDVLDGTQWEFEVDYGDQQVKSYGSNLYPGATDLDLDVTPEFKALLHALSLLLGGVKII